MNTVANPSRQTNHWYRALGIAAALAFFMLLTRGSHVLTTVSLPDASLVLFLLGGLYLKRWGWFAAFFMLGSVIDFGAAALEMPCIQAGSGGERQSLNACLVYVENERRIEEIECDQVPNSVFISG